MNNHQQLVHAAARIFDIEPEHLLHSHQPAAAGARQALIFALIKTTDLSLREIGDLVGRRNHATIIYSQRVAKRKAEASQHYANRLGELIKLCDPATGQAGHVCPICGSRRA